MSEPDEASGPNDVVLERRVPGTFPTMEAVWLAVKDQGAKLDKLIGFVVRDPMDAKAPPALMDKLIDIQLLQQAQTKHILDHEGRLTKVEDDVKDRMTRLPVFINALERIAKLETESDKQAADLLTQLQSEQDKQGDRNWAKAWDLAKIGIAVVIAYLTALRTGNGH